MSLKFSCRGQKGLASSVRSRKERGSDLQLISSHDQSLRMLSNRLYHLCQSHIGSCMLEKLNIVNLHTLSAARDLQPGGDLLLAGRHLPKTCRQGARSKVPPRLASASSPSPFKSFTAPAYPIAFQCLVKQFTQRGLTHPGSLPPRAPSKHLACAIGSVLILPIRSKSWRSFSSCVKCQMQRRKDIAPIAESPPCALADSSHLRPSIASLYLYQTVNAFAQGPKANRS